MPHSDEDIRRIIEAAEEEMAESSTPFEVAARQLAEAKELRQSGDIGKAVELLEAAMETLLEEVEDTITDLVSRVETLETLADN